MANQPVAIVTGGGRSMGRIMSLALARDGFDLVLAGPEQDEAERTRADIEALGRNCLALDVDVSQETQVQRMASQTLDRFGRIDVLVNNAGVIGPTAPVTQVTLSEWETTLAVNLTGAFLCCKHVVPAMTERRAGKIINIASIAGKIGYALRSPYAVSKWGLLGLTLTLAKEVGPMNIQVNAICPGPVDGDRMNAIIRRRAQELGQTEAEVRQWYVEPIPLKRMVKPEDVAAMVSYLASSKADNITGQSFDVNSGFGL
jgi:NAD(P)-dependent dehydrogenase (short-subunit alcohol dehydrogenase family)